MRCSRIDRCRRSATGRTRDTAQTRRFPSTRTSRWAYYARTATDGLEGDPESYQGRFEFNHDRYGAKAEHLKIGDVFNPEVGFVRRDDIRRSFGLLRFSPRPARRESPSILNAVRKFTWEAGLEYILNGADSLETRQQTGRFNIEFNSSDQFTVEVNRNYELLVLPFTIGGVVVPPGGYNFDDVLLSTRWASSAASPARLRCRPAGSTTGRSPRSASRQPACRSRSAFRSSQVSR